nr:uncharacterized protein LOC113816396 [Penaeus vannamei]
MGKNQFIYFGIMERNPVSGINPFYELCLMDSTTGFHIDFFLLLDYKYIKIVVWHGCEGYVYNVTKAGGQPHPEEIPIYTGSQWSIMGRDLTDYAVTHERRSDQLNRWHYHLQMSIIPDEAYFPTVTMNSPYANKSRPLGFHWLKKFEGRNTINLCRHMEDADFCGQGPGPVEEGDLREMMESSHRYFFARKFYTDNTGHSTRIRVTEHVRTNYYLSLRRQIPRGLLKQLADLAFVRLEEDLRAHPVLGAVTISPGDVTAFKVLPRLHLTNPCCSLPFERSCRVSTSRTLAVLSPSRGPSRARRNSSSGSTSTLSNTLHFLI